MNVMAILLYLRVSRIGQGPLFFLKKKPQTLHRICG